MKDFEQVWKEQEEQNKQIAMKEKQSAIKHGYKNVEEFREAQAVANRVKTYKAKIARLEKVLAEMKQYVEEHEQ